MSTEKMFGVDTGIETPTVVTGNIQSEGNGGFAFSSNVVDVTTGSSTVYVTLADNVFGGPYSGRVTISGVTGTTEANSTWYYQATDPNVFQLFNDAELTSPVDGSAWTAYVSGGVATSITANDLNIIVGSNTWAFDPLGNLTLPGNTSSINYANGVSIVSAAGGTPHLAYTGGNLVATANFKLQGSISGLVVETNATNNGYNIGAIDATGDSNGNTYILGYQQDSNLYYVQSIGATGTQNWIVGVSNIVNGESNRLNGIVYNTTNNTVDVGGYYNNGNSRNTCVFSLNPVDGSVSGQSVLDTTPYGANTEAYALDVNSSGGDILVGQIYGEYTNYNGLDAQPGSKYEYLAVSLTALNLGQSFNNLSWEVESSPGTWIGQNNSNFATVTPNNLTGSGSGLTAYVNWDGGEFIYNNFNGQTSASNGYLTNDILQVPGSQIFGQDNTNINAVATSWSTPAGQDILVFDKTTYPGLSAVQAGWYIINLNVPRPPGNNWGGNIAWGLVLGVVDTGTTYEITLNSNGSDWNAGSSSLLVTGGGQDAFGYISNGNWYGNTYSNLLINSPSTSTVGVLYFSGGPDFTPPGTWNLRTSLSSQAFVWTPDWQHTYGSTEYDFFRSVAHDPSIDYTYMFGEMQTAVSGTEYRSNLIQVNGSGVAQWSIYTEDANARLGSPRSVAAHNGYVYTIGSNGNGYALVTKLDSSGTLQWQSLQDNGSNWNYSPYGCVDSNGDVYVVGSWNDNGLYKGEVIKLSGVDGSVLWTKFIVDTQGYGLYTYYNDDVQNTTAVGTEVFAGFYGYDTNNSRYVALSVKLPADGSGNGTYGRWIISNGDATFVDNTSNAAIISNTLGTPTDQATQAPNSDTVTTVPDDAGGSTASSIETISAGGTNIIFSDGTVQDTAYTGAGANNIVNGTSIAQIADADGNLVIDLNGGGMSWNFSTDGYIYSKLNYNFTTVAIDDGSYNSVNQRVVTAGGSDYASTQLSRNNFNIYLNQQSSSYQWSFNNDTLYMPENSTGKIQSYNNAVEVRSMSAGNTNAKASLQSISNSNDPNVFTSIDATTTGANIVVWNGGSVGGTANVWVFDNKGALTFPLDGAIKGKPAGPANQIAVANGSGGYAGVTALFTQSNFTSGLLSSIQVGSVVVENNGHTANVTAVTPNWSGTGQTGITLDDYWNQSLPFTFYAGYGPSSNVKVQIDSNNWTFDNTGSLTIPGNVRAVANATLTLQAGNSTVNPGGNVNIISGSSVDSNYGNVNIQAGDGAYTFDYNGGFHTDVVKANVVSSAGSDLYIVSNQNTTGTVQINTYHTVWTFDQNDLTQSNGNLSVAGNISANSVLTNNYAYANGVPVVFGGNYGNSNVTALLSSYGSNTISTTGNVSTGNAIVSGTSSNIIRRAFGLVAADTYVQLDDIKARVTSSTSQLSLILASGSWQGTGWTETFTTGSVSVSSWVNLPLSSGFDSASGAMNSQGNGCRCVISDQTPSAKVYEITVVRSGTSGALWNISIERLV